MLARGKLCEVWRATVDTGAVVALKIPRRDQRRHPGAAALIRREFRVLEGLSHVHVLKTLGLIDFDGMPALMTEYLAGGDLVPLLGADPRHWVTGARDVALALVYLHERDLVHRDLKARNVLYSASGEARLVDFALATVVDGKAPQGGLTTAYARLAQRQGALPAAADDVHAFAVLLYELLAGRLPFGVNPSLETLQSGPSKPIVLRDGADPGLQTLADLVEETLNPERRSAPGSVRPFVDVLESIISDYE
jgi:serine/threonine-protein kinase